MCVVATPYAQADLGAVQRVNDAGLGEAATTDADRAAFRRAFRTEMAAPAAAHGWASTPAI